MSISGGCLCGAVRYDIDAELTELGACHCQMCRRWSGGIYLSVKADESEVTLTGQADIGTYKSSDWAERGFCKTCGSSVYYRVTLAGPYQGNYHFAAGTLDDASGLTLNSQMFIDQKPSGYAFTQETQDLTTKEIEAMFADVAAQT
ncbi:GFA family protein [Litoreibacter sp.]|nr:GFA family protein [Litoreibacter sp.]